MGKSQYNPEIHHRRSIRLKGYDYAGGGLYFVTICAHRDAGNIFATADVKAMVEREWEAALKVGHDARACVGGGLVSLHAEKDGHEARPYVVMPDHFHALIELPAGNKSLGDVICAFKSRVVHEYIAQVKTGNWPRFSGKIWHRNYYEMIVRTAEAQQKISEYIRMNPWRCVQNFGSGLRGMGNPALWNADKLGVLCSRNALRPSAIPKARVYFSGFHSPMEKEIFAKLMELKIPMIWCPAWGLGGKLSPAILQALEENRILMLEMSNMEGDLAAAEQRNRFILEKADKLWIPHINPGGMIDRLIKEMNVPND